MSRGALAELGSGDNARVIPDPRTDAWTEPERLVVNVAACYREFAGVPGQEDTIDLFGAMGRWRRKTHRFD